MNPGELGKRLGIGVRVAGRIARQRAQQQARQRVQTRAPENAINPTATHAPSAPELAAKARELSHFTPRLARAAGRGLGGFLRPFGRVGGILWLEVTGFFFALIALYFAFELWRTRLSFARGPQHQSFVIAAGCLVLFAYLAGSSFWRAGRK